MVEVEVLTVILNVHHQLGDIISQMLIQIKWHQVVIRLVTLTCVFCYIENWNF